MRASAPEISFSLRMDDFKIRPIMSLLHLIHKNVIIKFADAGKSQFNPEASYAFRLTGVDAMGFLQVQALRAGNPVAPETDAEPYWINKDLVREIHEVDLATVTGNDRYYTGVVEKAKPEPKADSVQREIAPQLPKAKKAPTKPPDGAEADASF